MPDTQTLFRNNKLRHGLFRPTGIFQFDERVNVSFLDLGNKTFEIMPKRTASKLRMFGLAGTPALSPGRELT